MLKLTLCKKCNTPGNLIIEQAPDAKHKQVRCLNCQHTIDLRDYNKKQANTKPLAVFKRTQLSIFN